MKRKVQEILQKNEAKLGENQDFSKSLRSSATLALIWSSRASILSRMISGFSYSTSSYSISLYFEMERS